MKIIKQSKAKFIVCKSFFPGAIDSMVRPNSIPELPLVALGNADCVRFFNKEPSNLPFICAVSNKIDAKYAPLVNVSSFSILLLFHSTG